MRNRGTEGLEELADFKATLGAFNEIAEDGGVEGAVPEIG